MLMRSTRRWGYTSHMNSSCEYGKQHPPRRCMSTFSRTLARTHGVQIHGTINASTLSSLFHRMHTVLTVPVCHSFGSLLPIQLRADFSFLWKVLFKDLSRLRVSHTVVARRDTWILHCSTIKCNMIPHARCRWCRV